MTVDPTTPTGAPLERLRTELHAWLTSVTPDGQPQTLPVWFLWEDGELLVYSAKNAVRNRNIRHNPHVSFHLNDVEGGQLVIAEGDVRVDEGAPPASAHAAYLAKYGGLIASYGWTPESFSADYPLPLRITPRRWRIH